MPGRLMKLRLLTLVLISLSTLSHSAFPQDAAQLAGKAYGPDQTLFNGKKYSYYPPYLTKGHQYLISSAFVDGTVTLRGTCYRQVDLNYDIFNQQVLMYCRGQCGTVNILEVSGAWLEGFTLGEKRFEILDIGRGPLIYQVLGDGEVRILYLWRKSLELETIIGSSGYVFSSPVREAFLLRDDRPQRFGARNSLLRLFGKEERAAVRNYLHRQRIRLKRADDREMTSLAAFIENLK